MVNYDLDKIKFSTDGRTFARAVEIYEQGGVKNFKSDSFGFEAKVKSSRQGYYNVYVSTKDYQRGSCDCYLGERGILCKHLVALAICAVKNGKKLSSAEKEVISSPKCSGRRGELSKEEIKEVRAEITAAMRYIKPYNGPSRIWFAYQASLAEGVNRLSAIVSKLPVSKQTADLLVNLLLRLDRKLAEGGVDDSDGTVGDFMMEAAFVLKEYAKIDSACLKAFEKLAGRQTCFDWEAELVELLDESTV